MIEKKMSGPCIVTLPPSKTCTTGTRLQTLQVTIVEDDSITRVLQKGTVSNDVAQVIAKGAKAVWTVTGGVAEAAAKEQ